jgi:hypothetical protein
MNKLEIMEIPLSTLETQKELDFLNPFWNSKHY